MAGRTAEREPPRSPDVSARDLVLSLLFALLWLLPISYQGLTFSRIPPSLLPPFLTNNYNVACLFISSVPAWVDWYYQIKLADISFWRTLRKSNYSTCEPFGHHNRIDLFLSQSGHGPVGTVQKQAIAEYIRMRYLELHPKSPEIEAVRFVRAIYRVEVGGEMARPAGHWEKRPLHELPRGSWEVLGTYYFDGSAPNDPYTRSHKHRSQEPRRKHSSDRGRRRVRR